MELPKKFTKRGKKYRLVKEYKHYGLYEEEKTNFRECFDAYDLGIIKKIPGPEVYLNKIPVI